jgi:hypothetical protein
MAVGFAALLIRNRLFIALGAPAWLRVAAGTLLLAMALRLLTPPLLHRLGIPGRLHDARWLLAVVAGVFAVRLGGLFHPATIVSDLIFHVHRLEDVIDRHIWYQEIPAIYDQNRPVPYPPGAYLLFAPFAPLIHDHAALLTVGTQLLDISRILVLGLIVWRAMGEREKEMSPQYAVPATPAIAATVAALLAGIVPIAFLIFSWGNLTNAVGEWALMLLFALLVLGGDQLRRPGMAVAFVAVVLLALLSHIGVAVTAVAILGAVLALWGALLLWMRYRGEHVAIAPWLAAVALTCIAGLLALALFYRIPLTSTHRVTADAPVATPAATANGGRYDIGGPRPDPTIGLPDHRTDNPVIAVAGQIWEEGYAFYRVWPLLLAPLGWWLLWRVAPSPTRPEGTRFPASGRGELERVASGTVQSLLIESPLSRSAGEGPGEGTAVSARLAALCVVWFGVSLLFLFVGVLAGRYVRYAMTAIPAVAVGAGVVIGYGWRWPLARELQ